MLVGLCPQVVRIWCFALNGSELGLTAHFPSWCCADVLPTSMVCYFILGSLILSFPCLDLIVLAWLIGFGCVVIMHACAEFRCSSPAAFGSGLCLRC